MDVEPNFLEIPYVDGISYIRMCKVSKIEFEVDENINGVNYRITIRYDDGGIERFCLHDENKWKKIRDKFLDYCEKLNSNA